MNNADMGSYDDWAFHQCVILGDRIDGIKENGINIGFINVRTGEKYLFTGKGLNK